MNLTPDQPPTLLYDLPRALDLQREPQNKSRSAPASFFNSTFFFQDNAALEWQLFLTIQEPGTIILTVLYTISFLVGFFGNVMSLKVLLGQHGSMRLSGASATRCLLINLAVCDLAVVCVCMPVTLGHRIYTPWVYGDFLCRAVPFTQAVSVFCQCPEHHGHQHQSVLCSSLTATIPCLLHSSTHPRLCHNRVACLLSDLHASRNSYPAWWSSFDRRAGHRVARLWRGMASATLATGVQCPAVQRPLLPTCWV